MYIDLYIYTSLGLRVPRAPGPYVWSPYVAPDLIHIYTRNNRAPKGALLLCVYIYIYILYYVLFVFGQL